MSYTPEDAMMLAAYVLLALVCSFLCSVAEAVLLSITPSYIEGLREQKPKHAALLRKLKKDKVDQSLSAILTLNTIAHTVGAIGAGAKATVVFGSAWFGTVWRTRHALLMALKPKPKPMAPAVMPSAQAPKPRWYSETPGSVSFQL